MVVVPVTFACLKIIVLAKILLLYLFGIWEGKSLFTLLFWHEKWHGIGYGRSYSMKSRVRRQKARSENGYLRKQKLKGFQQWKWLEVRHGKPAWADIFVVFYARIFREIEFFK